LPLRQVAAGLTSVKHFLSRGVFYGQNAAWGGATMEILFLLISLAGFGFFAVVIMKVDHDTKDVRAHWGD
jgi:hypothetical protein